MFLDIQKRIHVFKQILINAKLWAQKKEEKKMWKRDEIPR